MLAELSTVALFASAAGLEATGGCGSTPPVVAVASFA